MSIRAPAWLAAPRRDGLRHRGSPLLRRRRRSRSRAAAGRWSWRPMLRPACHTERMDDDLLDRLQVGTGRARPRRDRPSRPARRGRWPRVSTTRTRRAGDRPRSSPMSPRWLQFWLGEIERILAGGPEPVPFGRIATDDSPDSASSSATGRSRRASCTTGSTTRSTGFDRRWRTLTPADLARRGLHPRLRRDDDRGRSPDRVHRRPPRGPRGPARDDPARIAAAAEPLTRRACSSCTRSRSGSSSGC